MSQTLRRDATAAFADAFDRLGEADYTRIAALVGRHTGIRLPPAKQVMVEGRLRRRARATGYASLDEYCDYLFHGGGLDREFTHLLNAITTNKTDFFREPEHFTFLTERMLPELIKMRRQHGGPTTVKLWSAAASTGAEAYTIAMVMADIAGSRRDLDFAILGTDISTDVLVQARLGIYSAEVVAPVPEQMARRYLMRGHSPRRRAEFRIVPELRRRVRFVQLNLMDESYPFDRDMDVIFVRNVLIYFDRPTQGAVARRLAQHLRPGGFLVFGHSESTIGSGLQLRQRAPAVFQRI